MCVFRVEQLHRSHVFVSRTAVNRGSGCSLKMDWKQEKKGERPYKHTHTHLWSVSQWLLFVGGLRKSTVNGFNGVIPSFGDDAGVILRERDRQPSKV